MSDPNAAPQDEGHVFLFDKPLGWTSFQAVKKLKYLTKSKKIGHAGTLDPLASGLLVICSGKKTKTIEGIQAQPKEYEATIRLGSSTPSYDLETEPEHHCAWEHIGPSDIENALDQFRGEIMQTPPLFSAIKVDGKRAYDMARAGSDHQLKARPVSIYSFELLEQIGPDLKVRIACSKGTYIRSLAHDLGLHLGTRSHLAALRRTKIGEFDVSQALTPEAWQSQLRPETT
jgi:tRNA pseudouridine55 synthase